MPQLDAMQPAAAGQPISAAAWNAIVETLKQLAEQSGPGLTSAGGIFAQRLLPNGGDWLPFTAAADVPAGAVLVSGTAQGAADAKRPGLVLQQCDTMGRRPIYVSAPGKTPAGVVGRAMRSPRVPVLVAFDSTDGTPVAGQIWGPVAESFKLRAGIPGFKCLLAGDTATGLVWAEYDGCEEPSYDATLDEDLPGGGGADATLASGGGQPTVSVAAPWTLAEDKVIPSGKRVRAKWSPLRECLEVPGAAEC